MADNLQYQQFNASKKYVSDAEFTSLDTSTIPVGTEYNIVGVIEESDLSSDLQTKINKTVTIEQTTGSNTGTVMSQKAVTEELGLKQPLIDASTTLNLNSVVGSGTIQGNTIVAQSDMRAYATLNPSSLNFTRSDETPTIVTDNSTLTIPSNKTGTIATTDDITNATQNFITPASLIPGDNISITKAPDSEKVTISATGLVKQVTDTVDYNRLYGRTNSGNETTFKIVAYGTDTRSIAQRTEAGQLRTTDPADLSDAVNKSYFEANAAMQRITYSSDNKTISPTELALLKPGSYVIDASYTITNGTDSLPKDYYTMIKQGYISDVPYNDSTYLFQSYKGTVYAYSQYGASGYENKSAFYKLASTSDVATATAVLIDNSLIGG